MDVILLERVAKLGQIGDVVTVKQGHARNFLLPQGKALRANAANKAHFETQRAQLEAQNLETKKEAQDISARLEGQQFVVIRSASDGGALYGSVTSRDAAEVAAEGGFKINKKQVVLNAPIKELGLHSISVILHPEVHCTVHLNVARSQEEAGLQAAGQSIQELAAQAEAEAAFEVAELFDDIGGAASEDYDLQESSRDDTAPAAGDTEIPQSE